MKDNEQSLDIDLDDRDITLINLIVCKNDKLTIGAPSSPAITNAILFEFDAAMDKLFKEVTYSRYADDLYFSTNTPNLLTQIPENIKKFLKNYFIKLKINDDKTVFTSKKHKRVILGLTITTNNKISIGKKQKDKIKNLIYRYNKNLLSLDEINYLIGYISYIYSIEPEYLKILQRKYSRDTMEKLFPIKKK